MDYEKLTIAELKELCKEKNMKNIYGLKKSELIELLLKTNN